MDIRTVAMGSGPVPSFVVLEQHDGVAPAQSALSGAKSNDDVHEGAQPSTCAENAVQTAQNAAGGDPTAPKRGARRLPIRIGSVEAAAISAGVHPAKKHRPQTHDLLKSTIEALGAQLMSVRITDVSGTTFFAQLVLRAADGSEVCVDARPSDAIALAVRCGVNVLATEEVIEAASLFDFEGVREAEQATEMADFHDFVEHLSPEDFNAAE
jgi:uncharacterized protein